MSISYLICANKDYYIYTVILLKYVINLASELKLKIETLKLNILRRTWHNRAQILVKVLAPCGKDSYS